MVLFTLIVIGVAALFWSRGFVGHADTPARRKDREFIAAVDRSGKSSDAAFVDLSEKQANTLKIRAVGSRDFALFKTAVGTIDFNEDFSSRCFRNIRGRFSRPISTSATTSRPVTSSSRSIVRTCCRLNRRCWPARACWNCRNGRWRGPPQLLKAGGSAQKDVDQSTSDEQTAEGNFKAARDAVRIFGKTDAEIDQIVAKRKVDSVLLVPSPISGRIVARNAAPGFLTQPGNAPAPYSVADLSTMWMIANVIETDAPAYKLGQEVEVTVPAYPDTVFKGHVTTLGSTIDPNTHRQLVRSEIDDPKHLLRSGMFASFVIRVGDPVRSLAVPAKGLSGKVTER